MKPNNIIRTALTVLFFAALAAFGYAEDTSATTAKPPEQTAPQIIAKSADKLADTTNEFMRFALDKTKLYTGKAEDAMGWAVDQVQKEAPETVRQFLVWRFWYHVLNGLLPVLIFLPGLVMLCIGIKKTDVDDGPDRYVIMAVAGGACVFMSLVALFTNGNSISGFDHLLSAIQIKVAPRIYLIEQLTKLLHP